MILVLVAIHPDGETSSHTIEIADDTWTNNYNLPTDELRLHILGGAICDLFREK